MQVFNELNEYLYIIMYVYIIMYAGSNINS